MPRVPRGFTLLELLVAASLTAGLAAVMFVIVHNVAITWTRSSGRLSADTQARLILDQLALDLQGAQFRDDGNVWLAAKIVNTAGNSSLWINAQTPANAKPADATSLALTPPSIADARFGLAGVWLRFFTTSRGSNSAATPTTISAPVAVGYQIIRHFTATNSANQNTAYLLHRAESRPAADSTGRPGVLESGYNLDPSAATNYTTSAAATNTGATTGDPRSVQVPGTNTGVRNLDSVLADNVIDFGVRCYVRDATLPGGLRLIFPVDASGQPGGTTATRLRSTVPPATPAAALGNAQPFPDVIDVMVRILTDDGAQLIANMEKSPAQPAVLPAQYANTSAWWWAVAVANSHVYTRRIVINANSH